ncbi:hypothetical protein MP638_005738 [Amoeboaphelidium occidentale]|nr:hypothetical protein MP638_005738 [Amoeboaphelidium occidentale]
MSDTYTIALNDGEEYVITKETFDDLPYDSLLYNLLKDNQTMSTKNAQGKYPLILKTPQVFKYVLQILTERQFSLSAMREELKQFGFSATGSIECLKETLDYMGLSMPFYMKDYGQTQIDKIKEEIHNMPMTTVREQLFTLSWELYNHLARHVAANPFRVVFDKRFRAHGKLVGTEKKTCSIFVKNEKARIDSIDLMGTQSTPKEIFLQSYPVKIGPYNPRISYLSLCWLMDPNLLKDLALEYFTPVLELIATELLGYEFKGITLFIAPETNWDLWIDFKLEYGPEEEPEVKQEEQKIEEQNDPTEIDKKPTKRKAESSCTCT